MKNDCLKQYLLDLNQQYKTGVAREHAYRPALKVLMQSLLPKMVVTNETSISSLSAQLKGYKSKHIAPVAHWLYKDKLLSDIYNETYPFEE